MSAARVWNSTAAEYHSDKHSISHSGLDLVIEDPALYYFEKLSGRYVRESKPHYDDGIALDEALLRPSKYLGEHVVEIPASVLAKDGSCRGKAWKAFASDNYGKVLCKGDDELLQWVRAVQGHPAARALLEADGYHQHSIVWHDDIHGIERRCRFDFLHLGADVAVDLKTTRTSASLRDCANEAAKFGYHRQAAFYQDGAEELYGKRPQFVFIFVSKKPPYRVETFELDEEFLEIGREQNEAGLKVYAECVRTGVWLPKTHGTIPKLSPPGWVRWDKQWSA